jgi:hypothetical protein
VTDLGRLEALALSLPESAVADYHGMASFRVRGRIFATVPDPQHVRIMLDERDIRALVEEEPTVFRPVPWGSRLAAVAVDLRKVGEEELGDLLGEAWVRKAPARLARVWRESQESPEAKG